MDIGVTEVNEAVAAGAEIIMLDNMGTSEMKRLTEMLKGRVLIEASGGINLSTVRAVAECGVDLISVGALTHSAPALSMHLELE